MSKLDHYYETMSIAETLRGYDSYDPEYKAAIDDLAETFLSESRRLEETRMEENRLLDDSRRMEDRRQLQRMDEDRHAYEKRLVEIKKLDEKIQEEKAKLKAEQEGTVQAKPEEDKKDEQKMNDKLYKNVKLGEFKDVMDINGKKALVVENVVKMRGYIWDRTCNCLENKDIYIRTGTYTAFDHGTGKKIGDKFKMDETEVTKNVEKTFAVDAGGKYYEMHGKVANINGAKIAVTEQFDKETGESTGKYSGINIETGKFVDIQFIDIRNKQVTETNHERAYVSNKTGIAYGILPSTETDRVAAEIRIQQDNEYKQSQGMSR